MLKFKPWANVLGLDSQYQLDRLSGRYEDVESELHAERSVYDLRPVEGRRLDLWKLSREHGKKFPVPVVDTLYGSAALMPMADGARYEVWLTQSGLVARPSNAAANEASSSVDGAEFRATRPQPDVLSCSRASASSSSIFWRSSDSRTSSAAPFRSPATLRRTSSSPGCSKSDP